MTTYEVVLLGRVVDVLSSSPPDISGPILENARRVLVGDETADSTFPDCVRGCSVRMNNDGQYYSRTHVASCPHARFKTPGPVPADQDVASATPGAASDANAQGMGAQPSEPTIVTVYINGAIIGAEKLADVIAQSVARGIAHRTSPPSNPL